MTCYSSLYNQLELGNVFPQAKIQVQWSEIHAFTAQCLSSIPGRGTNIPQASQYSHTHTKKKNQENQEDCFSPENGKMKKSWFSFWELVLLVNFVERTRMGPLDLGTSMFKASLKEQV